MSYVFQEQIPLSHMTLQPPRCLNCGQLYESAAVLETHRSSAAVTCGACNEEFKSYCALGSHLCANAE